MPKVQAISLLQSKIAVGSGGFWGKGFGNGSQNQLGYIPVRYSDFIMSAWAEEQGFKGVLLALGLYMALLLRLVQNAQRAKDRAGMFSGYGRSSNAGVPHISECGHGNWRHAGNRHPVAADELRGLGHVVLFMAIGLVMNVRLRRFVN